MNKRTFLDWLVTIAITLFAVAIYIAAFWFAAAGSLPAVIFSGEKTLQEWYSPYPPDPTKTWQDMTIITCKQEQGFLVQTESAEGIVYYTCLLRIDAQRKYGA